jgi:hypothetical protein
MLNVWPHAGSYILSNSLIKINTFALNVKYIEIVMWVELLIKVFYNKKNLVL